MCIQFCVYNKILWNRLERAFLVRSHLHINMHSEGYTVYSCVYMSAAAITAPIWCTHTLETKIYTEEATSYIVCSCVFWCRALCALCFGDTMSALIKINEK